MTKAKPATAARDRASHMRMWITAGLGLTADLLTKSWAWRILDGDFTERLEVIEGVLDIRLALNAGVAFGIELGWWPIVLTVLAGIALVMYLFLTSLRTAVCAHFGLGLILSGALGNLADRLTQPYQVRDFINFSFWPTFNVADVALCVGVGLLALSMLRAPQPSNE